MVVEKPAMPHGAFQPLGSEAYGIGESTIWWRWQSTSTHSRQREATLFKSLISEHEFVTVRWCDEYSSGKWFYRKLIVEFPNQTKTQITIIDALDQPWTQRCVPEQQAKTSNLFPLSVQ